MKLKELDLSDIYNFLKAEQNSTIRKTWKKGSAIINKTEIIV